VSNHPSDTPDPNVRHDIGGWISGPSLSLHTVTAVAAVIDAARREHDFGGWFADVLACVAAQLGSSAALTAGRPGSWEAALVRQLLAGTVGEDDEMLGDYAGGAR
jgi:hypothetical protein